MSTPTITAPLVDVEPAQVSNPFHMHQTYGRHTIRKGCIAACGCAFRHDRGEGADCLPEDACSACADISIFGGGAICWGPR